ncbi:hypothetical protein HDU99_010531 [Rhizoclosmatium hyalinum]|nr:hypothetical protein HDU99_010531 [Rhizoclosmatium hyalinum]
MKKRESAAISFDQCDNDYVKVASGGKDVKEKRRPCHCKPILGIHVFKIKTSKTQVLWNVWNGGVCYFNNIRKRTWLSIATLDKVYALTIMSTVKCERVAGTNQISLSDFPSFAFNVVIEFKDEKALEGFLSEFTAHKAHMLVQHE